jgi:hypothetical protein
LCPTFGSITGFPAAEESRPENKKLTRQTREGLDRSLHIRNTFPYRDVLRTLVSVADIAAIAASFDALKTVLDERSRRLLAAAESQAIGKGGISIVAKATGISWPVIRQGLADLKEPIHASTWTCAQVRWRTEESYR